MGLLAKARILAKTLLAKSEIVIVGEFCHECGGEVWSVWRVPDDLWWLVYGEDARPRCQRCFERAAIRIGIEIRWEGHSYEWQEST